MYKQRNTEKILKDKKKELEVINKEVQGYFDDQSNYGVHLNDPKPSILRAMDIILPSKEIANHNYQ